MDILLAMKSKQAVCLMLLMVANIGVADMYGQALVLENDMGTGGDAFNKYQADEQATLLTLPVTGQGYIRYPGPRDPAQYDQYQVYANAGEKLLVTFSSTAATPKIDLAVYTPNGAKKILHNVVKSKAATIGPMSRSGFVYFAVDADPGDEAGGMYFLKVRKVDQENDMDLGRDAEDSYTPNAKAMFLETPTSGIGEIGYVQSNAQYDQYQFDTKKGDRVLLTFRGSAAAPGLDLLMYVDHHGENPSVKKEMDVGTREVKFDFTVTSDGPVYLTVDADPGDAHIEYLMALSVESQTTTPECNPGHSQVNINDVVSGKPVLIKTDPRGGKHVVYKVPGESFDILRYASQAPNSDVWDNERDIVSAQDNASLGNYSLAVDETGAAHISYYLLKTQLIVYATNKDGIWTTETVEKEPNGVISFAGIEIVVGSQTSIAVDSLGSPHIAYGLVHGDEDITLYYANKPSLTSGWKRHRVERNIGRSTPQIIVGNDFRIHIGFSGDESDFKYVVGTPGNWERTWPWIYTNPSGKLHSRSLTLDLEGNAHASYSIGSAGVLGYSKRVNGRWVSEETPIKSSHGGAIASSDSGQLMISYQAVRSVEPGISGDIRLAILSSDGVWEDTLVSRINDNLLVARTTSLAIDVSGEAHVAYSEHGSFSPAVTSGCLVDGAVPVF